MDVTTRNRAQLKSYYVKNSIPTESNFAELIDGMINQKDDGVVKLPGNPLSIEAAGNETGPQHVLTFYRSFANANADWTVSLNARSNASDANSGKRGFNIADGQNVSRLFIDASTGNVGLNNMTPTARLDIAGTARTGTHPTNVKGLYVTSDALDAAEGVEFRHTDGKQGIGFGYNTIYAAGSNADQDLSLKAKGSGRVRVNGKLQVSGSITPSAGNDANAGIMFPTDPFGGTGDSAWIRYHNARGGEAGTLELGILNDGNDHITLMPSGNVGVNIAEPRARMDVQHHTRSGNHPTGIALYATADCQPDSGLVEFRHTNGTQGIGFGWNTIYAAGSLADQDLNLKSRGTGRIRLQSNVSFGGNVGINISDPKARLDIMNNNRTGTHPNVGGLYVTSDCNPDSGLVEFRHTNGTQGIGFGYSTIYATGTNENQELTLKSRGAGKVQILGGLLVTTGAIIPTTGTGHGAGISFPSNPFGGGGDHAWIQYHNARGGEAATLEIGISNDGDDHIYMNVSGNVGIGRSDPAYKLDVNGNVRGSSWTNSSSRELKENITDLSLDEAFEVLEGLHPVKFNFREDHTHHIGFIAEDTPELVQSDDKKGIKPFDIVAVLARVVKEQHEAIMHLGRRLEMLEG